MDSPYEFLSRTGDGVCVVDGEQRIVLWNEAASELLGFAPQEALGRRCYRVLGSTDDAGCAVCRRDCAVTRAVRGGERVAARDVHVRTRDAGRVRVSVSTISLPASWRELSVLAHLFRSAEAREEAALNDGFPLDRIKKRATRKLATRARPRRPIEKLTAREHDVLRLLSTGASTEAICARLRIATTTMRSHVRSILQKLGVRDRLEAVTFGLRTRLLVIAPDDDSHSEERRG